MNDTERLQELKAKVREVRALQRQYFRTRNSDTLNRAKQAESELDKLVEDVAPATYPLFPEGVP